MYLTNEEKSILDGQYGHFKKKCMTWLVDWGTAVKAKKMVPVTNVHVLFSDQGNCIKGASQTVIDFFYQELKEALEEGAKCFTTTDISYISDDHWGSFNTDFRQVENNRNLLKVAACSGFNMVWTCVPYFIGSIPLKGEICAWAESSSIPFCNSVLGARTTRHSQTSSMAAAILGITPEFGELLDENRFGEVLVKVNIELNSSTDWGALGEYVGRRTGLKRPVFKIINRPSVENLNQLGASLATSGGTAMYHVIGITPEAHTQEMAFNNKQPEEEFYFGKNELELTYNNWSSNSSNIEVCILGCPHLNLKEIERVAFYCKGKTLKTGKQMWICTAYQILCQAERLGYKSIIEKMGGVFMADTCPAVACWGELQEKTIITNSFKQAQYLLAQRNSVDVRNMKKCIDSMTN